MGIRKTVQEVLVVEGTREEWLLKARQAMETQGFKKVAVSESLGQITGDFKQKIGTVWGSLTVTLIPDEYARTRMTLAGTANVDNVFALFNSPGQKLIDRFKAGLA